MTNNDIIQFKELEIKFFPNMPNIMEAIYQGININELITNLLVSRNFKTLKELAFTVFQAADEMRKSNEFEKAAHVDSLVYNLKFFYKTNASDQILLENQTYYKRLEFASEYEEVAKKEKDEEKIHKGTPYAFLSESYLLQGNIDWTFNFAHQAVEEDRRLGKLIENSVYYQSQPAFMTISLIDDIGNHMYPHIKKYIRFIKDKIESYNNLFERSLTYEEFTSKFLSNESFHDIKSYFTFNIAKIFELDILPSGNLKENDFISLAYLNYIFNLALIVDKILQEKYDTEFIAGKIKNFCSDNFGFPSNPALEDLKKSYKLDEDLANRLRTLIKLEVPYSGGCLPLEVGTLFATWMFRNFGAHQMKCEKIVLKEWKNIFQCLINSIFLVIDYYGK